MDVTSLGAENACRHRVAEAKGVADGHHPFAYLGGVGIAEIQNGQVTLGIHFEQRDIGFGVGTDHGGLKRMGAIGVALQVHEHLVRAFNHMIVRDDIAVAGNNKARAQRTLLARALGLPPEGAEFLKKTFHTRRHAGEAPAHAGRHFTLGADVYHSRSGAFGQGHEVGESGRRCGYGNRERQRGHRKRRLAKSSFHE